MGVCQKCGASLVEGALFCEKCGAKVATAPKAAPAVAPRYKPAWKKPSIKFGGFKPGKMMTVSIALVIAIIVLAGAMVAVVTPLMTEPKITQTTTVAEYVMSCAYKNYAKEELGFYAAKTMIQNKGSVPITDYKISYKIEQYTTDWCPVHQYKEIVPGQTVVDYYYPSLLATVLDMTTETTVPLEVKWSYKSLSGKTYSDTTSYNLKILGRNEYVWSSMPDSEMLGPSDWFSNRELMVCFVTKNEQVLDSFADNCTGGLETATTDNDALQAFVNAFYALRNHGVKYNQVGSSDWSPHFTQDIKYPKEVINQKAGTCIELAICIAAIMESVGIKSYIYLIPGHAIPAIALPNSGTIYAIESTFIDKDYAWSHHEPAVTQAAQGIDDENPEDVGALTCIEVARSQINQNYQYAWVLTVDVEASWQSGIVPPE